ncbi:MAG: hypothetical protein IJ329_00130 [Clostridia bacterium]|nr:hypothetical protein [Clostridia bacterium]
MDKKTYEEVRIEIYRFNDAEVRAADILATSPGSDNNETPGMGEDIFG